VDRFAVLGAVFFAVVRTVGLRAVVRVDFFLASAI
jgi:D-alanine-D-alanine ligase-like ATP-grasp enzyme